MTFSFLALAAPAMFPTFAPLSDDGFVDRFGRPIGTFENPIVYRDGRNAPQSMFPTAGIAEDSDVALNSLDVTNVRREWSYMVMGSGIGDTGLEILDLDGDGVTEILSSAGPPNSFGANTFWYVLSRMPDGTYAQRWTSDIYPNAITCLRTGDYDGDGKTDVFVCSGSNIYVYRGDTKALIATIATASSNIRGLNFVDVDSDGQKEFVFVDSSKLYIYNAASGALEQSLSGYGGYDVAVGNVDSDPGLEIVIGNDTATGYVLNGATRAVKWSYGGGFGAYIRLADIDGDGIAELVGANRWYYITAWDLDIHSPKWQINTSQDVDALRIADVDGDNVPEVIYGDGQWGRVRIHDSATGAPKWSIVNPEHGVTDIAVGNTDGDAAREIVFGAGYSSTGPDYLFVFDAGTQSEEWQSMDLVGPFIGSSYGDVDADGVPELLNLSYSSDSDYKGAVWLVHDARSKALEYVSPPISPVRFVGARRIQSANVDGDPQQEVFVTTSDGYDGIIICYDGLTHAEQFRTAAQTGQSFRSMVIKDVDNDGKLEIVAATARETSGAPGTYVYVFDAATGVQKWRSPISLGSYWAALWYLRVANVDNDPNPEIVVAEENGGFWVFDGVTHAMQSSSANLGISALDTPDMNHDGISELVVGTTTGLIAVYDPNTGLQVSALGSYGARIDGLQIRNVAGDASDDLIFCMNGILNIRYKDKNGNAKSWTSTSLGSQSGAFDSILAADFDGDGRTEIMLSAGVYGVRMFEVRNLGTLPPGG